MARRQVLILGIGSPFGTDTLGWQAVEALEQSDLARRFPELELCFEQSDRPGSRLVSLLQNVDAAILIDAMQSGAPAGTIRQFTPAQLSPDAGLYSTHGFGVAEALALGRQLGQLPERIAIFGIEQELMRAEALQDEVYACLQGFNDSMSMEAQ